MALKIVKKDKPEEKGPVMKTTASPSLFDKKEPVDVGEVPVEKDNSPIAHLNDPPEDLAKAAAEKADKAAAAKAKKQDKVAKQVVAQVATSHNKGAEHNEQIPVSVVEVPEPHATVGFNAAYTKNMGDYNSLKVSVSLFMPCKPDAESVEEAYGKVKLWVDGKMEALLSEVEE